MKNFLGFIYPVGEKWYILILVSSMTCIPRNTYWEIYFFVTKCHGALMLPYDCMERSLASLYKPMTILKRQSVLQNSKYDLHLVSSLYTFDFNNFFFKIEAVITIISWITKSLTILTAQGILFPSRLCYLFEVFLLTHTF